MSTPSSVSASATRRPRRRRLVDEVRDLIVGDFIRSGAIEPGQKLPSEKELAARYGVSRVTVRTCIRGLEEAGFVTSQHGIGSIVRPGVGGLMQGLDRLCSLDTFARESGQVIGTEEVEFESMAAGRELAASLEVATGTELLAIRRVKLIGGERSAWLVDYVPEGVIDFATIEREFRGSVLDVLLSHRELQLEYADSEVTAVRLSTALARKLNVPRGTAAIHTDGLGRAMDGRIVERAFAWLLPDKFRLAIRRRAA